MSVQIRIDASSLPFSKLVLFAHEHGYRCVQDNRGRIYFEPQPAPERPCPSLAEINEVYGNDC